MSIVSWVSIPGKIFAPTTARKYLLVLDHTCLTRRGPPPDSRPRNDYRGPPRDERPRSPPRGGASDRDRDRDRKREREPSPRWGLFLHACFDGSMLWAALIPNLLPNRRHDDRRRDDDSSKRYRDDDRSGRRRERDML